MSCYLQLWGASQRVPQQINISAKAASKSMHGKSVHGKADDKKIEAQKVEGNKGEEKEGQEDAKPTVNPSHSMLGDAYPDMVSTASTALDFWNDAKIEVRLQMCPQACPCNIIKSVRLWVPIA